MTLREYCSQNYPRVCDFLKDFASIGVSQRTLQKWLSGTTRPIPVMIKKVAKKTNNSVTANDWPNNTKGN